MTTHEVEARLTEIKNDLEEAQERLRFAAKVYALVHHDPVPKARLKAWQALCDRAVDYTDARDRLQNALRYPRGTQPPKPPTSALRR